MDTNLSLSFLYQNDPFYSFCASDLMTASQTVNNFTKEQKRLMKTLRALEQEKLSRLRQLSEDRRTFAFAMNKKLGKQRSRPQTAPFSSSIASSVRGPQSAPAVLFYSPNTGALRGHGRVASANTQDTGVKRELHSSYLSPLAAKLKKDKTSIAQDWNKSNGSPAGQRCYHCGHTRKPVTRRQSCPEVLQRHQSS